jgi:type I restriction enzyme S subunit
MTHEQLPEGWKWVRLGDVVESSSHAIDIEDDQEYVQVTVKMHHKGVVVREKQLGTNIGTKRQNRLHADQFIISKIDARNGAIGIVPDSLDGAVATFDFPTFDVTNKIDVGFLDYYSSTKTFIEQCKNVSIGTTNRSRVRMELFPEILIPLPPIDEQRRIAEVLRDADANLIKIEDGIAATEQIRKGFLERFICELEQVPPTRLNKALARVKHEIEIDPKQLYYQIGIRSHGKGIFHKEPITGIELGNKKIYWVEPGDFVLNIVFAWEGAVALVSEHERGMCGSHRFPTFKFNTDICLPEFLLFYFKTPTGVRQLEDVSPGGAGRNKTLNQGDFLKLKIPLPDLEVQQEIVASLQTLNEAILTMQAEAASVREVKHGLMQKLLSGEARV